MMRPGRGLMVAEEQEEEEEVVVVDSIDGPHEDVDGLSIDF